LVIEKNKKNKPKENKKNSGKLKLKIGIRIFAKIVQQSGQI
jgi:hypothetical protein